MRRTNPDIVDKTIKLWKVHERKMNFISECNANVGKESKSPMKMSHLRMPTMKSTNSVITATPRRVYSNAHAYHINSIAINSDGEHYLSADDLRINLWSLGISDQSFSKLMGIVQQ